MPAPTWLRPRAGLLALALLALVACREPRTLAVDFEVSGMVCEACSTAITQELQRLEGVASVEVDHDSGKATVTFTEGKVEVAELESAIERLGYDATAGQAAPVPQS